MNEKPPILKTLIRKELSITNSHSAAELWNEIKTKLVRVSNLTPAFRLIAALTVSNPHFYPVTALITQVQTPTPLLFTPG
jgi:hypothetical protein